MLKYGVDENIIGIMMLLSLFRRGGRLVWWWHNLSVCFFFIVRSLLRVNILIKYVLGNKERVWTAGAGVIEGVFSTWRERAAKDKIFLLFNTSNCEKRFWSSYSFSHCFSFYLKLVFYHVTRPGSTISSPCEFSCKVFWFSLLFYFSHCPSIFQFFGCTICSYFYLRLRWFI